jgi:glycosyltransferase involved in cell wall biosynthesis
MTHMKIIVAQMGAREHYQIPRMCHASGTLAQLHTDVWATLPVSVSAHLKKSGSAALSRFLGRGVSDIPQHLVRSYPIVATWWWWQQQRAQGRHSLYSLHEKWGKGFARRVARKLDSVEHTTFFGFSSASLEALAHERQAGRMAVLDVAAPTHLEEEILNAERRRFPSWESGGGPIPSSFLARLEEEWDTAHRIMVNSEWSKQALVTRGVTASKIFVVPIAYQGQGDSIPKTTPKTRPLRILWLGSLCLRKGFPYALEAAAKLANHGVNFTFAGPSDIDLRQVTWPGNASYIGQVPRIEVGRLWESHDLFLLPTLSDGFAITQIEAMAHGLPVISTHCCGDVVEDGLSGVKIESGSADPIVEAVTRFLDGEVDLGSASIHALKRARNFSPTEVWKKLEPVLAPKKSN